MASQVLAIVGELRGAGRRRRAGGLVARQGGEPPDVGGEALQRVDHREVQLPAPQAFPGRDVVGFELAGDPRPVSPEPELEDPARVRGDVTIARCHVALGAHHARVVDGLELGAEECLGPVVDARRMKRQRRVRDAGGRAVTETETAARQADLTEARRQKNDRPKRLLAVIGALQHHDAVTIVRSRPCAAPARGSSRPERR